MSSTSGASTAPFIYEGTLTKGDEIQMARKQIPLKHIYPKDRRVLGVLARAGASDIDSFKRMDITNNRIKSYVDAGLIHSVFVPDKHGTSGNTYYELTSKGQAFCQNECGIQRFISNGHAISHNAKVAETISKLSKQEIDSCLSEREIREEYLSDRLMELYQQDRDEYQELLDAIQNNTLSMPDIIYKNESTGLMEAIEVVTDAYGKEEIQAKLDTADKMGIEITIVHT